MKVAEKYTDLELIAAIGDDKHLNQAILFLYQQYAETTSSFIMGYGGSRQDAPSCRLDLPGWLSRVILTGPAGLLVKREIPGIRRGRSGGRSGRFG